MAANAILPNVLGLEAKAVRVGFRRKAKLNRAEDVFAQHECRVGPLRVMCVTESLGRWTVTVQFREATGLEYLSFRFGLTPPVSGIQRLFFPSLRYPGPHTSFAFSELPTRSRGLLGTFLKPEERLPYYTRTERNPKGFGSVLFTDTEGEVFSLTASCDSPLTLLLEAEAPQTLYLQPDVSGQSFAAGDTLVFNLECTPPGPVLPVSQAPAGVGIAFWPRVWETTALLAEAEALWAEYKSLGIQADYLSLEAPLRPDDVFFKPDEPANELLMHTLLALKNWAGTEGLGLQLTVQPFYVTAKSDFGFSIRKEVLRNTSGKALEISNPPAFLLNLSDAKWAQVAAATLHTLAPFADRWVIDGIGAYLQAAYSGIGPERVAQTVLSFVQHQGIRKPTAFADVPGHWVRTGQVPGRIPTPAAAKWQPARKPALPKEGGSVPPNFLIESLLLDAATGSLPSLQSPALSLAGDAKTGLPTEDERYVMLLANVLACRHLVLLDSPKTLPAPAQQTLQALLPHRPVERMKVLADAPFYEVYTHIRGSDYLALFNLGEVPYHFPLPGLFPYYYDGLENKWVSAGQNVTVGAHDALLLLGVPAPEALPVFAGSSVHFLPGQEIETLKFPDTDEAEIHLHPRALRQGQIWLALPAGQLGLRVNGLFVRAQVKDGLNLVLVEARNCPIAPLV